MSKVKQPAILILSTIIALGVIMIIQVIMQNREAALRPKPYEQYGLSPEDIVEYNKAMVILRGQSNWDKPFPHAPYLHDMSYYDRYEVIQSLEKIEHTLDSILASVPNDEDISHMEFRLFIKAMKDQVDSLLLNIPDESGGVG